MRTTVTLAEDVAAAVARLRHERGIGVSEAVHELVRAGLATTGDGQQRRPFRQRSVRLGLRTDVRNIGETLEQLDDPSPR